MHGKTRGGKSATGLRAIRRPVVTACLVGAVASVVAFLFSNQEVDPSSGITPARVRLRADPPSSLTPRLAAIRGEPDSMVREERIENLIENTDLSRIPSALDELRDAGSDSLITELGLRLLRRWAERDAAAAADWAFSLPEGDGRTEALKQVAMAWCGRDLAEAADWARSLPDETERDTQLLGIAHEAVRSDPMQALQIAADLPAGASGDELIRRAAMEWASKDAEGAAKWTSAIEDAVLREQVASGVALAWGNHDPAAAATFAVNELSAGRLQADTVVGIVQRWAQTDHARALAWVESFPQGTLRRDALASLGQQGPR